MKIKDFKSSIEHKNPNLKLKVEQDDAYQVGKEIEFCRAMRNMTQKELAAKIGTKQPSIARVESGASMPSSGFLKKIAKALKVNYFRPRMGPTLESELQSDQLKVKNSGNRPTVQEVIQSESLYSKEIDVLKSADTIEIRPTVNS